MSTIPPGWYKDPAEPTTQRWWDGEGWLGDPIPADATPPEGPPPTAVTATVAPPITTVAAGTAAPTGAAPPTGTAAPSGQTPAWQVGGAGQPVAGEPVQAGAPVQWPVTHRYPVPAPRPHGFMLAGASARFMARLVDVLAVLLLASIANVWFAIEFWRNFEPVLDWATTGPIDWSTVPASAERASTLLFQMGLVLTAVWFAYEVPASANSGQTLGKRIFGIKVLRVETDGRLGFGRSFRRWFRAAWPTPFWLVCWGIPILLQVIDCLFVAFDRRLHQALHDRIAHTVVVQVPRAGRPETARTPVDPDGQAASTSPEGRHADPR